MQLLNLLALTLLLSPCATAAAVSRKSSGNPVIALYRRWTRQYLKDAQDAAAAAKMYANQTKLMAEEVANRSGSYMPDEMKKLHVGKWAHAAWTVDGIMHDPTSVKAGAAAAAATAPYTKAYADYTNSKMAYDGAAVGYALRAKQDAGLSKQLMTYSHQFRLQGDMPMADAYLGQSENLMSQAEKFKGFADQYSLMAHKLYGVLPTIQDWAGKAGAFAAYGENPYNVMTPKDAFPYTVVPPAPEFLQTDALKETQPNDAHLSNQAGFLAPHQL